jgi:ABC-2 type transport system ATP-binding protein/lipopolysaccharide transport system ATP-binding protein
MPTEFEPAHDSDVVISLEDVAVRYRVPREPVSGIKEYAIRLLQRRLAYEDFWALNGVSIQVHRGEVFGVIGSNGSGKSTLLKVIARVLYPTRGRVILRGRVAPLLELGAGFHQELTGLENIFLNSALLGRSRTEVEELLPEIIEFAEIGDFINSPIRTYSTGMVARLGFSVATCVRPDILLVDEVLSVGDARFARKCLERMYSYQLQGTTILIVSHSMSTIETFCERALWLQRGSTRSMGPVAQVIEDYITGSAAAEPNQEAQAAPSRTNAEVRATSTEPSYRAMDTIPDTLPADGILNVTRGSFSARLMFPAGRRVRDCAIFHTDDSRYILYIGTYFAETEQQEFNILVARAGGNRRAMDTFYGSSGFPEVSTTLSPENTSPGIAPHPGEWHHVTMTWAGYPQGSLRLYLNGVLVNKISYDRRYSDGRNLPSQIAVGMRPASWEGEIIENEDGSRQEFRPESTLDVADSGLEVRDLRLYPYTLTDEEILEIYREDANTEPAA